jgi:CubicO group peptidase (beta-lactamase class C family)
MTRDHLSAAQRASAPLFLGSHGGWGYGMAVPGPSRADPPEPSGYGWNGGTGTVWTTDPDYGLTGIVLSTRAMTSPEPPAHMVDFWQAAYGALAR